jgi:hypothetical protein
LPSAFLSLHGAAHEQSYCQPNIKTIAMFKKKKNHLRLSVLYFKDLELMKSIGKSWQCIDLQVKYGISIGRPEGSKCNLKCVSWFVFHYFYSHQALMTVFSLLQCFLGKEFYWQVDIENLVLMNMPHFLSIC